MTPITTDDAHEMIDALLDLEEGLTAWEVEFVDSVDHQRQDNPAWKPTEKQYRILERIYDEHA